MIGIGELAGLGCAAMWAIISTVMKAMADRISPIVVNGLRCGFASLALVGLLLLLGKTQAFAGLSVSAVSIIVASGVLGQAFGDAMLIRSMKLIGASRALPVSATSPLLTLALAALFLGERIPPLGVFGTFMVVGGITLLVFPYGTLDQATRLLGASDRGGLLMALGAATCWALSTVILKEGLANIDLFVANLIRMSTATALLFGLEAVHSRGHPPVGLKRRSVLVLGLAGTMSAFSSLLYLTSVYYAGAAKAAVLSATAPLFGLPIAIFFLRERVNRRVVLGTLLSTSGLWLVLSR